MMGSTPLQCCFPARSASRCGYLAGIMLRCVTSACLPASKLPCQPLLAAAVSCAPYAQVQSLKKYAKTYELDVSNLGSKEELVSAIQRHWAQQARRASSRALCAGCERDSTLPRRCS